MTYRVATNSGGFNQWWDEGEAIPFSPTAIREATPEETFWIDRIKKQNAAGRMPSLAAPSLSAEECERRIPMDAR
jgi:hypothetical protein